MKCPYCYGKGSLRFPGYPLPLTCTECKGSGKVESLIETIDENLPKMTKKGLLKEIGKLASEYLDGYQTVRGSIIWKKTRLERMLVWFRKMIWYKRRAIQIRRENDCCTSEKVLFYAGFAKSEDVPEWYKESSELLQKANEIWLGRY